jgi:hypothetical protein
VRRLSISRRGAETRRFGFFPAGIKLATAFLEPTGLEKAEALSFSVTDYGTGRFKAVGKEANGDKC